MALIKCTECNNTFSDYAKACPKCGCPVEISTERKLEATIKGIKQNELALHSLDNETDNNSDKDKITDDINVGKLDNPEKDICNAPLTSKDKKRKKAKIILVVVLLVISLGLITYDYLNKKQIAEQIIELENIQNRKDASTNLKIKPILDALLDQTKYWSLTVTEFESWYGQNPTTLNEDRNMFCVVVGISFEKDTSSIDYIDDSFDDGYFTWNLENLKLNGLPLFPTTYQSQCFNAYEKFDIGWTADDFYVKNGDTYYFLAKLNRSQLKEKNLLEYNNLQIINLLIRE